MSDDDEFEEDISPPPSDPDQPIKLLNSQIGEDMNAFLVKGVGKQVLVRSPEMIWGARILKIKTSGSEESGNVRIVGVQVSERALMKTRNICEPPLS